MVNLNILHYLRLIIQVNKFHAMENVWCIGDNVVVLWEHGCHVYVVALLIIHIKLYHKVIKASIKDLADIWKL